MRNWVVPSLAAGLALALLARPAAAQFLKAFKPPPTTAPAAPPAPPPAAAAPDPDTLLAAARANVERLQTAAAASWTVRTNALDGPMPMSIDVLRTPKATRYIFRAQEKPHHLIELARVIETPDAWYVTEGDTHRRCRPYECEFKYPACSVLHELARPRFVTAADLKIFGLVLERKGPHVRYLAPVANPHILRYRLAVLENAARLDPVRAAADRKLQADAAMYRRLLAEGLPIEVDADTGLIESYFSDNFSTVVFDLNFLDAAPDADLDPAARTWQDETVTFPLDRPADLVMVNRRGRTLPFGTDCLLLDLVTGRTRRVPFRGARAVAGCFTADRTRVIVPAFDYLTGVSAFHEIDLKTGADRRLPGTLDRDGVESPALSPDGRTLAAVQKRDPSDLNENEIFLVDLRAGAARSLKQPFHAGRIQWHPDARSLLATKSSIVDPHREVEVGRYVIDDGSFTPIFSRGYHVPIPERAAILSADMKTNRWSLCDLDGTNVTPLGDGMADYLDPALSPDGKRLLMVQGKLYVNDRLVIVDIATGRVTPVPADVGGWNQPAWR